MANSKRLAIASCAAVVLFTITGALTLCIAAGRISDQALNQAEQLVSVPVSIIGILGLLTGVYFWLHQPGSASAPFTMKQAAWWFLPILLISLPAGIVAGHNYAVDRYGYYKVDVYAVHVAAWSDACGPQIANGRSVKDAQSGIPKDMGDCVISRHGLNPIQVRILEFDSGSFADWRPHNDKDRVPSGATYVTDTAGGSWSGPQQLHGYALRYILHQKTGNSAKYWLELPGSLDVLTAELYTGQRTPTDSDFADIRAIFRGHGYQIV